MKWRKLGRVFLPDGSLWWARSYAHLPTPRIFGDTLRIYFAGLDDSRVGRIGYVEINDGDPAQYTFVTPEPVLDIGAPGLFDDSGVNPACFLDAADGPIMYYIGWHRGTTTPYALFAGAAREEPSGELRKIQRTPVLDRTKEEPFLRSAMSVLRVGEEMHAWYVCGLGWGAGPDQRYPSYVVRHAKSPDGLTWPAEGVTCIDFAEPEEFGIGRPWVIRDGTSYKMWYSIRSTVRPYRIGYAESGDGLHWERRDSEVGISASPSGWDSEMLCYPAVVDIGSRRLMFYNGNRHGETGFGVAEMESD